MFCLLAIPLAKAAPETTINSAGAVVSTVTVSADPASVLALLSDPSLVAALSGDGISAKVSAEEPPCMVLDYNSASRLATVEYRLRQCAVDGGFDVTLISSEAFSVYDATWRILPSGSATTLTYSLYAKTTYFFPDAIIRQTIRSGVDKMMRGLEQHLSAQGTAAE